MALRNWCRSAMLACACVSVLVGGVTVTGAHAQEALNTPAPTQPAVGGVVTKHQLRIYNYGSDPTGLGRSGIEMEFRNEVILGLSPKLSLSMGVPLIQRSMSLRQTDEDFDATGFGDLQLSLKHRFWQHDPGPVDTRRLAVYAGINTPTGHTDLSPQSWDPFVGAVFMAISGRHGFNQSASWTFTTGAMDNPVRAGESLSDVLEFDSAYLYRIEPREYTEDFVASLYGVLELNGTWETNGDFQLLFSPGLLYEAPNFALEAGVQVPLVSEIDERMELNIAIVLGLRILF